MTTTTETPHFNEMVRRLLGSEEVDRYATAAQWERLCKLAGTAGEREPEQSDRDMVNGLWAKCFGGAS